MNINETEAVRILSVFGACWGEGLSLYDEDKELVFKILEAFPNIAGDFRWFKEELQGANLISSPYQLPPT